MLTILTKTELFNYQRRLKYSTKTAIRGIPSGKRAKNINKTRVGEILTSRWPTLLSSICLATSTSSPGPSARYPQQMALVQADVTGIVSGGSAKILFLFLIAQTGLNNAMRMSLVLKFCQSRSQRLRSFWSAPRIRTSGRIKKKDHL